MTGLLLWQLKSLVDEEIARGAQGWREEKRRGMQEVEELERELNDESDGKRRAEDEVKVSPYLQASTCLRSPPRLTTRSFVFRRSRRPTAPSSPRYKTRAPRITW